MVGTEQWIHGEGFMLRRVSSGLDFLGRKKNGTQTRQRKPKEAQDINAGVDRSLRQSCWALLRVRSGIVQAGGGGVVDSRC